MSNRKKAVTTQDVAEVKHYGVSAGEMPASPPEANAPLKSNVESLATESSPSTGTQKRSQITEQRRARRFRVCSPATIRWLGSDDAVHEAVGIVRDISTCGVYVNAEFSLGINNNVELEIVPFGVGSENPKTELHLEGKVVRTKQQGLRPGFAVAGFLWLASR